MGPAEVMPALSHGWWKGWRGPKSLSDESRDRGPRIQHPIGYWFGLLGASAMSPIDATGWSSKIGLNVSPASSVFHTPPEAEPTYTSFGLPGTPSTSATRPLILTGPRLRHSSSASGPLSSSGAGVAAE